MEAEWSTIRPGKLALETLFADIEAAAAPIGVKRVVCEVRRASLLRDEITYKFDQSDSRDEILALYDQEIDTAHAVVGAYPGESREAVATLHLSYDGRQSRLRVESPSLRFLERLRAQMAPGRAQNSPEDASGTPDSASADRGPTDTDGTPGGAAARG